jgi:hypothetical protein
MAAGWLPISLTANTAPAPIAAARTDEPVRYAHARI